jgi:hypothetical protein
VNIGRTFSPPFGDMEKKKNGKEELHLNLEARDASVCKEKI